MAGFTTRVELHKATSDDYETLHTAMTKEDYTNTVTSTEGSVYQLPTAEYILDGNYSIEDAFVKAEKAAQSTGKAYWIFITEAVRWKWELKKIK